MSLYTDQLQSAVEVAECEFRSPPGAIRRSASCVTSVATSRELDGCRPGELIVFRQPPERDDLERISAAVERGVAAIVLPAGCDPDVVELTRAVAFQNGASLGVCAEGVDPLSVAVPLSRSLADFEPGPPLPGLQGAETLQGLAEILGRLVGNSATIETPSHELLASSPTGTDVDQDRVETILHRRASAPIMSQPDFKQFVSRVRLSDWPLRLPPHPGLGHAGRVAMRIASAGQLYGIIWLTDTARPLSEADLATIRQASDVAAAIFVREQMASSREARLRAELLDEVMEGRIAEPENIRTVALSVGWNVDRLQLAIVVAVDDMGYEGSTIGDARRRRTPEQLLGIVKLEVLAVDPRALIGMRTDSVIAILDVNAENEPARKTVAMRIASGILNRSAAFLPGVRLTVGAGRGFDSLEHMAESVRQAELAVELGRTLHGGNIAFHYDDLGIRRVLYSLRDSEGMITPGLQRILDHDAEHGTEYAHTLGVYLKNMGRLPQASKELNIHRNTLEYRMSRVSKLADVDLDDPDSRLALELGYRVLQLDGRVP